MKPLLFISFLLLPIVSTAQFLSHEVGVFTGRATFQTDFGQRGDFLSTLGNNSTTLTFAYYLQLKNYNSSWSSRKSFLDHLMIKTEFNYIVSTDLRHYGKYSVDEIPIDPSNPTGKQATGAMRGSAKIKTLGVQLEYYFKDLYEFYNGYSKNKFNPFVNLGISFSTFENEVTSTLGDWQQNINLLPDKYKAPGSIQQGEGKTSALNFGMGTRYQLTPKLDLAAQFNWYFFFSDIVDGLNADVPENKRNDGLTNIQVGLIYHLNFKNNRY